MSTSQISVSRKNLKCSDIVKFFYNMKIPISLTENKTIICNEDKCWSENGCRIILTGQSLKKRDIKNVWNKLNDKFNLRCAHIDVEGGYKGCIYDYISDSKCPGPERVHDSKKISYKEILKIFGLN